MVQCVRIQTIERRVQNIPPHTHTQKHDILCSDENLAANHKKETKLGEKSRCYNKIITLSENAANLQE